MLIEKTETQCLRCKSWVEAQIYLARDGSHRGVFVCPFCKYIADPSWVRGDNPQQVKDRMKEPPPFSGAFKIELGSVVAWKTRRDGKDYPKRGVVLAGVPPYLDAYDILVEHGAQTPYTRYRHRFHRISSNIRYLVRINRPEKVAVYYCPTMKRLEGESGGDTVVSASSKPLMVGSYGLSSGGLSPKMGMMCVGVGQLSGRSV